MPTYDDELLAPIDTLRGYDRWAPTYDHDPNSVVAATSWVLDRAPLGVADADVLELGCGTGRNIPRILGEGARSYLGLDGSHGMLTIAAQRYQDPRVTFGVTDLTAQWALPKQFDFALIVLVLEHLPILDPLLVSLARAIRPGGRVRIVDLHPERIASGSFAHFQDGTTSVHFSSVAHAVPMLCAGLEAVGFESVRRDWLAGETMLAEVPGISKHRGTRLVLDLKATRRSRDRRGSGSL
ncbi:MAG TPA: class I SAM-dependent methyltransferase [Kofleriaceae bacterium]|nr:class I SAM-dependent methyltransferase [Kofleriaceae bacterium]